ncbi:MAG TPA: helix-turn-helix domain-containing protein [Candidatus Dormibacteraeota bacterium]
MTPPRGSETVAQLRSQLSNLVRIFALSLLMFDQRDERAILDMAAAAVADLGPFWADAGFLVRDGGLEPHGYGHRGNPSEVAEQVERLEGRDGAVFLSGLAWSWAYALGSRGHLVVAAGAEPPEAERFLLRVLAQQAGAAISGAMLQRSALRHSAELSSLNEQLAAHVGGLERRARDYQALLRTSVAGEGEAGIARVMHELTGLPVAIEDGFGNLRAWAGPGRPDPYPRPDRRHRTELLRRGRSAPGPLRAGDRLVAVAQPRGDIIGVVALVDPDGRAGPLQALDLEHAALLLCTELIHGRSLADMQLRLSRDLVDDLCGGTDEAGAMARAGALGHDLGRRHQVAVVNWTGAEPLMLARAVERCAAAMDLGGLLGRRQARVVLVAHLPDRWSGREQWLELQRAVARELRSAAVAVGVGGVAAVIDAIPRSCEEAFQALAIRQASQDRFGVTMFEELGMYRLLAACEDTGEIDRFVQEWLGALLDYDAAHHSRLVSTLSHYCDTGGNYDRAAEVLNIHRSTLRYRLQRIRKITGRDLADVDTSFHLHAATRAWRFRQGSD